MLLLLIFYKWIKFYQSKPDEELALTEEEINLLNTKPRDLSERDKRKRKSIQLRQTRAKQKKIEGELTLQQKKAKNQKQQE